MKKGFRESELSVDRWRRIFSFDKYSLGVRCQAAKMCLFSRWLNWLCCKWTTPGAEMESSQDTLSTQSLVWVVLFRITLRLLCLHLLAHQLSQQRNNSSCHHLSDGSVGKLQFWSFENVIQKLHFNKQYENKSHFIHQFPRRQCHLYKW